MVIESDLYKDRQCELLKKGEKYLIKEGQNSLYNILKENAYNNKDQVCFNFYQYIDDKDKIISLTRQELLDKSLAVGKLLKENNIQKNDKVIIFSTNTSDNILSFIATNLCGSTCTIIMPPIDDSKTDRFISVVESLRPKFILSVEPLNNKIKCVINSLIDKNICKELLSKIKIIDINKAEDNIGFIPEEINLDHVAIIQYTSGSTSKPKGIMTSLGNLISMINSHSVQAVCNVYSGWLPFCHIFALHLAIAYPIIVKDSCANVMTPSDFIKNPYRWFKLLSDTKAEVTAAPNSIFETYPQMVSTNKVKGLDLSNMKKIISGSEPANLETMEKFVNEYKEIGLTMNNICIVYGLSECTGGVAMTNKKVIVNGKHKNASVINLDEEEYLKRKIVIAGEETKNSCQWISSGDLFYGLDVKIVNPKTLKECKKDEIGEIWIQSPGNGIGYYNNEKATLETFNINLENYSGSFLRTGDLGFMYNDELYVTGRIKELIIVNGRNILPNDIVFKLKKDISEIRGSVIMAFPAIADNKEQVVIIVAISEKEVLNYELVKEKIRECTLKYFAFTPYDIRFTRESHVPRADSGKISANKIKDLYNEKKIEFIDNTNKENDLMQAETKMEYKLIELLKDNFSFNAGRNTNLLAMGMNSIDIVKLSNLLLNEFDIEVPVKFIFSNSTVEKIGKYIEKSILGDSVESKDNDKTYLYNDAVLPEDILINEYEEIERFNNIFLTGGTGFVGAYLIDKLIKENVNKIYCLVRAKSNEEGFEKIKNNMKYYKIWKEEYSDFIVPVQGYLDKPLLGIEDKEYEFLCENIDVIYHNGAVLNFIYPYETLKSTNVSGTVETLRIACNKKMKYYNYVSSYSIYDNPSHLGRDVLEDDKLEDCRGYALSYSESKWVCEKIINIAIEKGMKAAIYRPGDITGSVSTGIWKYSDMVSRIIKSMLKYRVYPEWDKKIYMTPVNYVAEAIIKISMNKENYNRSYNIMNKDGISIEKLASFIKECGYELKNISYEEFISHIHKSDLNHPLKPLESLFKIKEGDNIYRYGSGSARYSTLNTENALADSSIKCPDITVEIINKYIKNFL